MAIEIVFVLDRSGSMSGNEQDVVGGVNTLLDKQREMGVDATVSMVKFDNHYEEICRHIPLSEAHLKAADYIPRGSTSLLDAVGKTINMMGEDYRKSMTPPKGVMFVIFTDGQENSSREYTGSRVRELIDQQEKQWNWEFVYMGAAVADFAGEVRTLGLRSQDVRGFSKTRSFAKTRQAFTDNYADLSAQTVAYAVANNSAPSGGGGSEG